MESNSYTFNRNYIVFNKLVLARNFPSFHLQAMLDCPHAYHGKGSICKHANPSHGSGPRKRLATIISTMSRAVLAAVRGKRYPRFPAGLACAIIAGTFMIV